MLSLAWWAVLAWNVATLCVYGWDKWRSKRQGRRVPERTLLTMLFAGGVGGAWLGMSWFRHKTRKQPFRNYALLWTLLNPLWLLVWWTARELW